MGNILSPTAYSPGNMNISYELVQTDANPSSYLINLLQTTTSTNPSFVFNIGGDGKIIGKQFDPATGNQIGTDFILAASFNNPVTIKHFDFDICRSNLVFKEDGIAIFSYNNSAIAPLAAVSVTNGTTTILSSNELSFIFTNDSISAELVSTELDSLLSRFSSTKRSTDGKPSIRFTHCISNRYQFTARRKSIIKYKDRIKFGNRITAFGERIAEFDGESVSTEKSV